MIKHLIIICLVIILFPFLSSGQPCQITQVTATPLACNNYTFFASVNLSVTNPSSPGFTLAGNGVIYGTWLYSQLPVTVGPLYGDNHSKYEFIAWDVENPECQNYDSLSAPNCGTIPTFTNFTIDSIFCIASGIAAVNVDFIPHNQTTPTFDLFYANGTLAATALYSSLPYLITNFTVNGAAPITVKLCDHNNAASCKTFTVPAIDCSPNNCEIYSINADPECINNGNFVVHLNFNTDNPASDSFTVHGNNINYGKFGYNELPVLLGPLNGSSNLNWQFIVQDSKLPTCTGVANLGVYHCPPPCDILSLEANAIECNGNNAYALQVDMEIEGQGDTGYSIFSNDYYYGTHSYSDLPLTIPDFAVGNFIDQVTVCDNKNPGCCATAPFQALLCNGCIIYNLTANPLPCNDQGEFYISIDFDYQNVSAEGFSITGSGTSYGNYTYDQVPVLLGPFPGNDSLYIEFVVTDLVNDLCFDATEIGVLPCSAICNLSNLTAETGDCTGNDTYILHVNFDHTGSLADGFDLYANGVFYDNFNYSELPLTILEFPSGGTGHDTITVCDNDNSNCCATISFTSPDCHCSIFETTVQNLACTSDTTFAISVEFFSAHLLDHSVDAFIDGLFIGTYNIDNLPFIIDNIHEGTGTAVLTICGHDESDCCDNVAFELMNCIGTECSIWNLQASHGDCNSDSTYTLSLTFNHLNLPNDSVNIWGNDHYLGKFLIQPDSISIEHFPVFDDSTTTLKVCAVGNDTCCATYNFTTPDCSDFGVCHINELSVQVGACQSDSDYILVVNFIPVNLPVDSVVITANDQNLGTFQVNGGHITIEHAPIFDNATNLSVCAVDTSGCCADISFDSPNCGGQCGIDINFVEIGNCTSDSTYNLILDFLFQNLPTDSVTITANDTYIGTFQLHEGHFVIENFPEFPGGLTMLHVCATGVPNCCDDFTFDTPSCPGDITCHIFDLVVHTGECLSDSTFTLILDFQSGNLPSDSVVITANDVDFGIFPVNGGHIVVDTFPIFPSHVTDIHVCAFGAPDCCAENEFEGPFCDGQCHIYGLTANPGECTSDSTFILNVVFQSTNLPTDSVLIYANDHFIGTYHVDPEFIRIDNFPVLDGNNTNLVVCSLGSPDCCDNYSFITPSCDTSAQCLISDVSVQTFDCNSDSTFAIIINFHFENILNGGFDVYTGDSYLGFFTLEQIPIETSQFPANTSGSYVVTICENDNSDCCTSYEFEGPVCGPGSCDISNLQYTLTDCDSAGNFFFILNFNYQNEGASGFNVVGNGNIYGNFSYDQLPIHIGPFPTDNTSYEFLITDAENPACFDLIDPGVVSCLVGTSEVDQDEIFQVLNNGSIPGIFARKDITLSLYNSNGKLLVNHKAIADGTYFDINSLPSGVYIATIIYQGNTWPVKLVKAGY